MRKKCQLLLSNQYESHVKTNVLSTCIIHYSPRKSNGYSNCDHRNV